MPKNPSSAFGPLIDVINAGGRPVYNPVDGKALKEHVRMRNGQFKGMAVILEEQGFRDAGRIKAMCKGFHCQLSKLENKCKEKNIPVLFLPKFHCKLNPIEQCWGYIKQVYHLCPLSTQEDLERNMVTALEAVPFTDAYSKNLDGKQAAWAYKKFKGHQVIPEGIMHSFDTV
ncbi:hypothetical protein P691DRAFT_799014 [Macrolepiota fuliginosa MF-IS2]|uniref:Tc1-like transposase DDE domain-containing protein n=1 Tax=Macrolepiota fuliginosa MF-IS2 TaxID=1400762 RepID=A0A9P5X0Q9_9AGAR|nr:hypothetical protein P691DRAFT_799014 [Macrolepiota fuliginosa MF-IS2]